MPDPLIFFILILSYNSVNSFVSKYYHSHFTDEHMRLGSINLCKVISKW